LFLLKNSSAEKYKPVIQQLRHDPFYQL